MAEHATSQTPPQSPTLTTQYSPVAIDSDDAYEESNYGSEIDSITTSLAESVTNYKYENGRRYHAFKEGSYIWPNDERESERLDIVHKMILTSMGNKLFYAPIKNPQRVLDLGTGTGIWAIEFADEHPGADVLGNDLSPIQPRWVPPNLSFEVDDMEADWVYSRPFDFIHCRAMSSSLKDWPRLMRQCFEHTKPGGYVEFQDFSAEWTSPDGSINPSTIIQQVGTIFIEASRRAGIEPNPGPMLAQWCLDAGFVDIEVVKHPVPCGVWPADKKLKEVGAWNYLQAAENIDGIMMAVFTRMQGMTAEEVHVLAGKWKAELKNPKIHPMLEMYVVTARKSEVRGDED